ncbi:hypothetical protein [Paraliobacillus salinarum]|uniref:hypothetical protein n=1 Tax=Paraliobacillus salinarum TaxID=1158996 RepID=UPI0015F55D86|nr:hypothetical protein [Paraliobacillus salinarum]
MYCCRSVPCPAGTARAEDPLGKVIFFTKLAEAVPAESEYISSAILVQSVFIVHL